MKILIVDDKPAIRSAMEKILISLGFSDVTQAADGLEAWHMIEEAVDKKGVPGIDLIISDLEMPEMTGLELLQTVREHHATTQLPFIMATNVTEKKIILQTMRLGVQAYIIKPFDRNVVELKLKQAGIL